MADSAAALDEQVRAADIDRWLSSRFVADERLRADLIALYAFEAELMAIPTRVTQPLLAEMRYVWWREQMDGVFAGVARKGWLTPADVVNTLPLAALRAALAAKRARVH